MKTLILAEETFYKAISDMFYYDRKLYELAQTLHHIDEIDAGEMGSVAMDLLGLPQDNTVEMSEKYGNGIKVMDMSECFCRDYWFDLWMTDSPTPEYFIEEIKKELNAKRRKI